MIWRHIKLLRKEENCTAILKYWYARRRNIFGIKLGFTIGTDVFGEGLLICHYGNIVVNSCAKVGGNCKLDGDNCIGNDEIIDDKAPIIGENVDVVVGAKIIGEIEIADNIVIGAGAVVMDSFKKSGITIGGVLA